MNPLINLFKIEKNTNNINITTKTPNSNINQIIENNTKKQDEPKNKKMEYFLKIDKKNTLSELDENEISRIKSLIENFKVNEILINNNINKIMNKLLEKNSNSNLSNDTFIISQNISKLICKNNKIGKDNIDNVINYLMKSNKNKTITSLLLNKKKCEIIGSVLCYSFSRLQQYKIKDMNKLIELRKTILEKGIDVQKDFTKYCKENKNAEKKITYYWKSQRNKYICLPEFIFLINIYSQVAEIQIDFNLFDESLNEDETQTQLIELTILNIHWLFNSLKSFKINLINEKFQDLLYNYYNKVLNMLTYNYNEVVKKNKFYNEEFIFKKKWNFRDFFKIEENRNISSFQNYNINSSKTTISILKSINMYDNIKSRTLSLKEPQRNTISNFNDNNSFDKDFKKNLNKNKFLNDNNIIKESFKYILKSFYNSLELILMTIFSLSISNNCNNLEIVMNDSYTWEFLRYFKIYLGFEEINENMKEFNILDILVFNKINNIKKLNIEINTLDYTTFENLLNIIYINKYLSSINLSFFSSDVTYTPQFLSKIFRMESIEDKIANFQHLIDYNNGNDIEEKILDKLSIYFTNNLSVFFELIKNLNSLDELCLNLEIPYNIKNKSYYMNPIIKLILNILFYGMKDSKFKKLCILSPNIEIDTRKIPNANNLLNNINVEDNFILKYLSLHFQFYQVSNITNFISERIQVLNIGDLDIYTFKILCEKICNPIFNLNSLLQGLSIGLLNSIIDFTIEIKLLLRKLFNIKIKNLLSLSLYTNIIIYNEIDYDYLLQILDNNWISEYTILFNYKSSIIISSLSDDIKNIKFFVPHNLEKKLLEPDDIMKLRNNPITLEVDNNKDYYDDAYWYLKYLFENVYVDKIKNEKRNKKMIMGILKYLYFLKTPKINNLVI